MKNLVLIVIYISVVFITGCGTDDPVEEATVLVDKESAVVVSPEEQSDGQVNYIEGIVQNLTINRDCYVGGEILLKATVKESSLIWGGPANELPFVIESLALETNNDRLWISVDMRPLQRSLLCIDYYKEGETRVFPILITAVEAEKDDWHQGDTLSFHVYSKIMVTEKLKEELLKVDCWKEKP